MSIVTKYDNIVLGENEIMIYISHLIPDDEMKENIEFEKEDLSQIIDLLEELQ